VVREKKVGGSGICFNEPGGKKSVLYKCPECFGKAALWGVCRFRREGQTGSDKLAIGDRFFTSLKIPYQPATYQDLKTKKIYMEFKDY
jgi:hypothetical protein